MKHREGNGTGRSDRLIVALNLAGGAVILGLMIWLGYALGLE